MRLWYLSHRQPAKAQASLRIRPISPEPSLFAHMKYGSRQRVQPKIRHLALLDGCTCTFEAFTEDEKYHSLMSRVKLLVADLFQLCITHQTQIKSDSDIVELSAVGD